MSSYNDRTLTSLRLVNKKDFFHLFYVKVPIEWNLKTCKKIYIMSYTNEDNKDEQQLWAIDDVFVRQKYPLLTTLFDEAPQFIPGKNTYPNFVHRLHKLMTVETTVEFLKDISMASIVKDKENSGPTTNTWRLDSGEFNEPAIDHLKKRLQSQNIELSSRISLYHWALMTVAGLLDSKNGTTNEFYAYDDEGNMIDYHIRETEVAVGF